MAWSNPRTKNYYALITAVEIQLKQQKLFDPWKTVSLLMNGPTPFKEVTTCVQVSFNENELTDVDSESDLNERSEVDRNCNMLDCQEEVLERRKEPARSENVLPQVFEFSDLAAKSSYQVRVRCANKYGWGNYSKPFSFCPREGGCARVA